MTTRSTLDKHHVEALVNAYHEDPFAVLGPHGIQKDRTVIRVLVPDARSVAVVDPGSHAELAQLEPVDDGGLFEAVVSGVDDKLDYRLKINWHGHDHIVDDAYRYDPILTDYDIWLLAEGRHLRPYEQLGAHPNVVGGVGGVRFAVWAPNARRVSVVGDFNNWDGRRHQMRFRHGCGVWEIFIPGLAAGERYKYEILGAGGELLPLKADPYGFAAETRPANASVVASMPPLVEPLSKSRSAANQRDAPISIYEVQLGSWARGADNHFLDYAELADRLVAYVRDQGFTHIELLPISEYPFDGSWGYQPVGLYAPTARFGTSEQFRDLIAACHKAGIGVILDWVPGHFPTDPHGLEHFDGTCLYEHADPRQGFHRDWNTLIFNYGRREVCNYLFGNALYWLERFGVDGLRVDAVASMLYLDYSREGDDWVANQYGSNENLEAIEFLRELNGVVGRERPGAIMIAEESTAWPQVSQPPEAGGLGFHYKWNLGWMNDTLEYMQRDPAYRSHHHNEITFSLTYAFDENFILPLSHDEVVHGKGSIIARMPGDDWQQFANLRAYYGFLFTHPGKKLLFMGDEIAQRDEWNHDQSLDWHLLENERHAGLQRLVSALNAVYTATPALHRQDCDPAGFEWISYSDHEQSTLSFIRHDDAGGHVICLCNLTPVPREAYRIGVPAGPGAGYRELLNTDAAEYGGSGMENGLLATESAACHGRDSSIVLRLPPLATVILIPA